jgi:DNA-binding MarR family transcriptional regulator
VKPRTGAERASSRATDARLIAMVELLFFAYRDFTADPDAVLAELDFGRAHHRVLHFVDRNPGLRVADLLGILRITKQSLARVLKQLVDEGYIEQTAGPSDRRERRLTTTEKGKALAGRLLTLQTQRIAAALAASGLDAQASTEAFLLEMISAEDRDEVRRLTGLGGSPAAAQRDETP